MGSIELTADDGAASVDERPLAALRSPTGTADVAATALASAVATFDANIVKVAADGSSETRPAERAEDVGVPHRNRTCTGPPCPTKGDHR
jgi:hypothetical protein